ncbi:hypothetical protein CAOG_04100 [Capsaspora owczarzaki ATCC 30864]|uniref:hypothetical protein n=1 Tax=Capsaspora owczarzaki (strain ATCC 30864) TaxID=595528 RepID=UPI0003521805|nr:hypothetical protein CAOG_04100 [Capsaspora owczarzaki ATCC 30864]|eukprot:XP_004347925.2 hypothetical protein CAOG_04100 [Capsaspora owczarzaki ATCC 30864]
MSSGRRRAEKSLVCLLQALHGQRVSIELHRDMLATGDVDEVDVHMNVLLYNVVLERLGHGAEQTRASHFDTFFVQAKHIRYVHLPDEFDAIQALNYRLAEVDRIRQNASRKKRTQVQLPPKLAPIIGGRPPPELLPEYAAAPTATSAPGAGSKQAAGSGDILLDESASLWDDFQ